MSNRAQCSASAPAPPLISILDAAGLEIRDPQGLETEINSWPGVVTVGLFAARGADVLLLGTSEGVKTFKRG